MPTLNSWGEVNTNTFTNAARPNDIFEIEDLKNFCSRKAKSFRFVGPVLRIPQLWFDLNTAKGKVSIPKIPTNFDFDKQEFTKDSCPYMELAEEFGVNVSFSIVANAIVRDHARNFNVRSEYKLYTAHEKKTLLKESKDSEASTPCRIIQMNTTLANQIKNLQEFNKVKFKSGEVKTFFVSHEQYGCDVSIKFDSNARQAASAWSVHKEEGRTPLTEEEKRYLLWDLSQWPLGSDGAEADAERMRERVITKKKDEDDEKPTKAKAKKRIIEDDDNDDVPLRRSSKSKVRKVDPEDDGDDWDSDATSSDDDDDEDAPPAKKTKPATSKVKKKAVVEDDDDDWDSDSGSDDEDDSADGDASDDDWDDEPAPAKKTPIKTNPNIAKKMASKKTPTNIPAIPAKRRPSDEFDDYDIPF